MIDIQRADCGSAGIAAAGNAGRRKRKMKKGYEIVNEGGRRIVRGTGWYPADTVSDLKELVKGSVLRWGGRTGFKFKDGSGAIATRSYAELDADVDALGTAFHALGLAGRRIAICSENRYEWSVAFFAAVNGTGIVVPLDKYLPKTEVLNLVRRGKVEAIVYGPSYRAMMAEIAVEEPMIRHYVCMDSIGAVHAPDEGSLSGSPEGGATFHELGDLLSAGAALMARGDRRFMDAEIDRKALSVLLFTSGTTALSKGVMLSHANLAANVTQITTHIWLDEKDTHLSLLPLHHTFENTIGQMLMIHRGTVIAYCEGIKYIADNIREFDVTVLVAVPAILEAIWKKVRDGIVKSGKADMVDALAKGSDFLRRFGIDMRRKLFRSVFEKLGPNLRLAVSGAAPLDADVVKSFGSLGLNLIQGYGLTETSPVLAANNDFINEPGTIGYPLSGIELSIDQPDANGMGEIIARGPNLMLGYYEDPAATAEAIDREGWFHTGDLGTIDEKGFTRITGRLKSMIVLSNGKKAFPEEYEVHLNRIPGVKDSFVWGYVEKDGDVKVCAKLIVDGAQLPKTADGTPDVAALNAEVGAALKAFNAEIPAYKALRYYCFSTGELIRTTTLKTKRGPELDCTLARLEELGLDMRRANGTML